MFAAGPFDGGAAMKGLLALALLATILGAGTATAAKPKPPRLQDYCVTRAERRNNAVQFKAADGATLRGVLLGPRTSRRGVVIAHEGAGGLCNWLPYGRRLARLGYRTLVFDLRGFVSSPRTRQRQGRLAEYPLWDSPYLFVFVLACLSTEWALRKRFGLA